MCREAQQSERHPQRDVVCREAQQSERHSLRHDDAGLPRVHDGGSTQKQGGSEGSAEDIV